MFCPLTKEQCTDECAWFKKSRRRYQDNRLSGECLVVKISCMHDELIKINGSIKRLEQTIRDTEF